MSTRGGWLRCPLFSGLIWFRKCTQNPIGYGSMPPNNKNSQPHIKFALTEFFLDRVGGGAPWMKNPKGKSPHTPTYTDTHTHTPTNMNTTIPKGCFLSKNWTFLEWAPGQNNPVPIANGKVERGPNQETLVTYRVYIWILMSMDADTGISQTTQTQRHTHTPNNSSEGFPLNNQIAHESWKQTPQHTIHVNNKTPMFTMQRKTVRYATKILGALT